MKTEMHDVMLFKGCHRATEMSAYWYFCKVFPVQHLDRMVDLTNAQMCKAGKSPAIYTNAKELIQLFGIILLIPQLPPARCRLLWNEKPRTKYGACGGLLKTKMTRHRFEEILQYIW